MQAIEVVDRLCKSAKQQYRTAIARGDGLFLAHDVTTPRRLGHFLAQIFHESGGLTILWESGQYSAARLLEIFGVGHHSAGITPQEAQALAYNGRAIFERVYGLGNPTKARQLGNTRPGDGYLFRGGGLMQTTGGDNYRRMGMKCGVDFYNHPELIVAPEHALKPALIEWTENKLNDYADRDNILAISRAINLGNVNSTKTPNGFDSRKQWYSQISRILVAVDFKPVDLSPPSPTQPIPAETVAPKVAVPAPSPPPAAASTGMWAALGRALAAIFTVKGK